MRMILIVLLKPALRPLMIVDRPHCDRPRSIGESAQSAALTALAALAALLGGCGTPSVVSSPSTASPSGDRPAIVVSGGVICDLAGQIAGDTIDLTCLVQPGRDLHTYEPTPADRTAIESAKLVLYGGYGFEGGLLKTITSAPSAGPKVALFEQAVPQPILTAGHDHEHDHEHDHDHDHDHDHGSKGKPGAQDQKDKTQPDATQPAKPAQTTGGQPQAADSEQTPDPHIWHDPKNGVRLTEVITDRLASLVPDQADRYRRQAATMVAQFQQLDRWITSQVATVPADRRKLVTTHDSLRYYAQAYGFQVKGALSGLSTEARPSPGDLAELVQLVKAAGVPAIFAEVSTNPKTIETVAREAGVQVAPQPLFVDGPGAPDSAGATYQTMLTSNTCTIVNALGGKCDPKTAP
ncbi:MAG: metal ABC transporter substrate-binding protein [Oscillatoriales cyanobacterium]|nr:MAG: metal ABC transporter substrate-binding protein [Oscillatoriales cyanobacterium]